MKTSATFSMTAFEKKAAKFLEQEQKRLANVGAETMRLLEEAVVNQTPLDSGQLKSNWFVSVNSTSAKETKDTTQRNRKMNQKTLKDAIKAYKTTQDLYLRNSLVYAPIVEFGGYPNPPKVITGKTKNGFSTQAPKGMLRINVAKLPKFFNIAKSKYK